MSGRRESLSPLAIFRWLGFKSRPRGLSRRLRSRQRSGFSSRARHNQLCRSALHAKSKNRESGFLIFLSGRRESNPVFTHPKRTYYRYTTARVLFHKVFLFYFFNFFLFFLCDFQFAPLSQFGQFAIRKSA